MRYPPKIASLLAAAVLTATATSAMGAQMGRLDDQTEYAVITGAGFAGQHGHLLAVVLWHGPPGWMSQYPPKSQSDSLFRVTRFAAEEKGLSMFGSIIAYGLAEEEHRAVIIEGQRIPLWAADSAVVIMVAIPGAGEPRRVSLARMPIDAVPEAFWPKTWQSGDTTFMVHPTYPRDAEMLKAALLRAPAIATFLR